MILVYDDVDDDYMISGCPIFGVIDDRLNDRTHKVTIESEVLARYYPKTSSEISLTPVGLNAPAAKLTTPTPRVIESKATLEYETFRFNPVIYTKDNGRGTQTPIIEPEWVTSNMQDIKNIYARVGVKKMPNPIQIITPVQGVDAYDGIERSSPELERLLDTVGPSDDPSDFYLIFIGEIFDNPTPKTTPTYLAENKYCRAYFDDVDIILGIAFKRDECDGAPPPGRANNAIVSSKAFEHNCYSTSSHEIGHCLTRYSHFDPIWNLMATYTTNFDLRSSIFANKRFSDQVLPTPTCVSITPTPKNQEERIHEHDQVN